jgi:methyl-accepting chemotaxis protein
MDEVTQQNSALVEEAAAAAESLEDQAQNLASTVATFKVDEGAAVRRAPPARPAPARKAAPAKAPARAKATAAKPKVRPAGEEEWEEF